MSRSLVGSSRSSTLGSVSSSLSSWKRRRSPPDRSPSRAVSRSPVKPKRSSSEVAVSSWPSAVRVTRRMDSTVGSTRPAGSMSSSAWVRCCIDDRASVLDLADARLEVAGQQGQHRGLAGTVDPHDPDPVPGAEPPGGVVEQLALAAEQVDVLDVEDVLAEALGGEALQLHPVAGRRDVLDELVGGIDAELRLGGAGRGAAAQPGELLLDQLLATLLGGARLPLALRLGQHERRVAALVAVDGPVVDLPRRLAHLVEEPAVVGDDDEGAGPADEVLGEPGHRLDVEVVGGLVEHDQVVAPEQQRGQGAAATLAAGQPEDGAVQRDAGEQLLDDAAHHRVGRPLVVGEAAQHGLADRVGVDELVALVQVADLDAAGHRHPAGVGLLEPGHHLEQGGLAVPVATDDADALPRRDAEGDLVEQRAHAVRLGDPLQVDQVGCDVPVLTSAPHSSDARTHVGSSRAGHRDRPRRHEHHVVAVAAQRARPAPWAAVGDSARNRQVGPEPETSPRTAPSDSPRSSRSPRSGRRSSAGSWRSLCSAAPSRCGSRGRQRREQRVGGRRLGVRTGEHLVEAAVDGRRGQPAGGGRYDDPPPGPAVGAPASPARRDRCRARCRR